MEFCEIVPDSDAYVPRKSSRRDPWTEAEAREALSAAKRSGLSLAAFARRHGVPAPQLYWWHMRIRTHPSVDAGRLSFVPVVPARQPPAGTTSGVELVIDGVVLHVEPGFCEQTLARTVAVLRSLRC